MMDWLIFGAFTVAAVAFVTVLVIEWLDEYR